jgi:hypothetical protein
MNRDEGSGHRKGDSSPRQIGVQNDGFAVTLAQFSINQLLFLRWQPADFFDKIISEFESAF